MSGITEQPEDQVEALGLVETDNADAAAQTQELDIESQDSAVQPQANDTQNIDQSVNEDTPVNEQVAEATQAASGQQEMPFALVQGEAITQLPLDLYIPPDALEVILEQFEGPLDLLLYLIRKQNLDILEINVYEITKQYMQYVELMQTVHLELAGEYLVMAAMLAEIKSRILLPRPAAEEGEEEDPRAELIRRLQDYERFKQAAEDLDEYPRMGRDTFEVEIKPPEYSVERQHPDVDFKELMLAFGDILLRANNYTEHEVYREKLSTRERMSQILDQIQPGDFVPFGQLYKPEEGRGGVVTTFLATLELIKEQLIEIVQNETFGPIHVKVKAS